MATSSITANFTIKDPETAERFVLALEASSGERLKENNPLVWGSQEEARAFFRKREKNKR